jgi:hypothetical protein
MSHPGTSASAIANPAGRRIGRTCRKNNRNYLDAPNLTSTSSLCVAIATSLRPRSAADHVGPDAPNRRLRRTAPERTISTATSNPASAQNDRIRRARSAAPAPVRLSTSAPRQTQVAACMRRNYLPNGCRRSRLGLRPGGRASRLWRGQNGMSGSSGGGGGGLGAFVRLAIS